MSTGRSPEVLIVGAGPAGLATAIACAQRGFEVVVLEREAALPIDKACGEGLMPDAVQHLADLGVRPPGCRLEGIRYTDGVHEVYGAFLDAGRNDHAQAAGQPGVALSPRPGLGVRRTDLSAALRRRAQEAGATLRVGDACLALRREQSRGARASRFLVDSQSGQWSPRVLVGADGLHSQVRQQAGLALVARVSRRSVERLGVRQHFQRVGQRMGLRMGQRVQQESSRVEVFWAKGSEAYVTPLGGGVLGVAFLFSRPSRQGAARAARAGGAGGAPGSQSVSVFERHLAKFPELHQRLAGCEALSRVRGAGPLRQRARRHAVDNLALVGDAGGYVDAITGEGLAIAFAEAVLLAERLVGAFVGSRAGAQVPRALRRYHQDASRRRLVPEILTQGALVLSRRPWLRSRFLRALGRRPCTFEKVLALHTRASPDLAALPLAMELSWRLALG